jgi:phosphopantothenate-cysteine ligase
VIQKMNVLITSGGTRERIDPIRSIANKSTGRLGSLIADRFANSGAEVTYICSNDAIKPDSIVNIVEITDTYDLEREIRAMCAKTSFNAIIHAMAVSDYRVRSVTSGGVTLDRSKKISSALPELTVTLEPAPKIIALFSGLAPSACLVGFKLLDGSTRDELFSAAEKVLRDNNCTFVLANDSRDIRGDGHIGHLLGSHGATIAKFHTKQEIADGIYKAVMEVLEKCG